MVRLTDRPDMTLDVYRGRKTTMQCNSTNPTTLILSSLVILIWNTKKILAGSGGWEVGGGGGYGREGCQQHR